jgi:hypothetical protein
VRVINFHREIEPANLLQYVQTDISGDFLHQEAFTQYTLARASQIPGMPAESFHASRITEAATRLQFKPANFR